MLHNPFNNLLICSLRETILISVRVFLSHIIAGDKWSTLRRDFNDFNVSYKMSWIWNYIGRELPTRSLQDIVMGAVSHINMKLNFHLPLFKCLFSGKRLSGILVFITTSKKFIFRELDVWLSAPVWSAWTLSLLFYLPPVRYIMCLTNVLQDQYHTTSLDKTFILWSSFIEM